MNSLSLMRSRNINAPVDGVRPNPLFGDITQFESTGKSDSDRLTVGTRIRLPFANTQPGLLNVSYTFGHEKNYADSATSLQYLKRYYKLVILSNVDRASSSRSNEKLGVAFDRILTAQDIGSYKPSLRNFEYALGDLDRTFGTKKGDILHTAQSIFHDIVPARSVGLATMWINRRKSVGGWR